MKYEEIVKELGLNPKKDEEATEVLNQLLEKREIRLEPLEELSGSSVIVFGAGPSLKEDVLGVKKFKLHNLSKTIAADGAVKALLEKKIIPDFLVTDLDGDKKAIIKANRLGVITIVHAHGDNIPQLKKVVPKLKNIIGTTQSKESGKLKNFGGFTDGDRAVFIANYFKAEQIILAGMDFGKKIGSYSGQYMENKTKKLEIGKKLIEELARQRLILNLTKKGEYLRKVPKISPLDLKILLAGL